MDAFCIPPAPSPVTPSTNGEAMDDALDSPPPPVDCEPVRVLMPPVSPVAGDDDGDHKKKREKWFNEMRGWLIVVAVLVASVTYQAGLNPPGGFWQDSDDSHRAGALVLESNFPKRYASFFYFNTTAFLTSLAIIVLLMNKSFYHSEPKVVALEFLVVLDMVMLMGAYLAGSTRAVATTMYTFVFANVVLVSIYVVYTMKFMSKLWGLVAGLLWARARILPSSQGTPAGLE